MTKLPGVPQPNAAPSAESSTIPLTRPSLDEQELAAVAAVLESGWLAGQGPWGTKLEQGFAKLTGQEHGVAVNSCTAGLHLVLQALGVGLGDEVLVADYSFPATAHAVAYCGATPVFVDVRADTGTIDPDLIAEAVTPRTRGILGVDALGVPADWDPLEAIAQSQGLFLIEDAACSAGASYNNRACGSFGDVAVFSLHARKGITCGEGGVIVTDDGALADSARRNACFGIESAFARQTKEFRVPEFQALGYNYKLSDVLAAIACVQLTKIGDFQRRRELIAQRYGDMLSNVPGIRTPTVPTGRISSWQTYAVTLQPPLDRNAVATTLRVRGVGCNIGTYSLNMQDVYNSRTSSCPVSKLLSQQQLALPMHPQLTEGDQDRVVEELIRATIC